MNQTKTVLKMLLERSRSMLAAATKAYRSNEKGALKHYHSRGSWPADNFELLDTCSDVKLYQYDVELYERKLKAL